MKATKMLKITQVRSQIGFQSRQRKVLTGLGLGLTAHSPQSLIRSAWLPPAGVPRAATRVGLVLVGVVLASTALIQAPLHGRLAGGFSPELHRLLVASNWLRTATWSLRGGLVVWMALRGTSTKVESSPVVEPGDPAGSGATPK